VDGRIDDLAIVAGKSVLSSIERAD